METRELARRIEAAERAAWIDGDRHLPDAVRATLGRRLVRWGDVLAIVTERNDSLIFNRTLGVGLEAPADDALLDAIRAVYASAPNPHAIQLSPFAEPADLPERLTRRGYAHHFSWIKWWRDATPAAPVPTTLRITPATPEDAERVVAITAAAFKMPVETARSQGRTFGKPGWRQFLAWDGDHAVASATVFLAGDTAWLGGGATLPSHRGRGAQGALIAARIEAARAAGCTCLTVETGPDSPEKPNPSYRNVARAGFRIAYERPSWVWPDPARPAG